MTYCLLLSDSGCVDKFIHSSNCVNELKIIKLTTCHEFLLAQLCRFFKKEKKTGQTSVAQSFRNHNTVSREKAEMRLSGIGFVKNILL